MMKILCLFIVLLLLFSCNPGRQQKTDSNYGRLTPEEYIPELTAKLHEISGLLVYDSLFWGFNDSGGKDVLYAFDSKGQIVCELKIRDASNKDWESITQDEKHIYVGDFGNNRGGRNNLCIYKIDKTEVGPSKKQKIESEKISFEYAKQNTFDYQNRTTPYDCEAMVAFADCLYIFSKNWNNFSTTVYKLPKEKGAYSIHPLDSFQVNGLITGADISPDKKHLVLLGYKDYKSFIWLFSSFSDDKFFKGKSRRFNLEQLDNSQTEGICFYNKHTLLVATERTKAFRQQVFQIDISKVLDGTH